MMVTVGEYQEDDFDGLCRLMKDWGSDYSFSEVTIRNSVKALSGSRDYRIVIAKNGDLVIGYAQTMKTYHLGFDPFVEVVQLLVAEENRSCGIGGRIMDFIENTALEDAVSAVKLHSNIRRSGAHLFYENRGYECYKTSKFYEKKLIQGCSV